MAYKQSPFNFYDKEGDPKKKANKKDKKAADAYAKGNDKKGDRLTEGSLVRQSLRRRFGSNRPK
jgi:hypothetical protein|tara:strand:+ start:346 stop:537 length:192 start_codon:yes stop_codon:yes gene_type:complete